MLTAVEQKRLRDLITETVTVLCQSSLNFKSKFTVEGLLGITIDDKDVLLINIHEVMSSLKGKRHSLVRDMSISCNSADDDENTALSESHITVDRLQSCKMRSVKKSSLRQTSCSQPCSAHKAETLLPCEEPDEQIAHSFTHDAEYSGMSLPADVEPLETSLSSSLGDDGSEPKSDTTQEVYRLQDHHTNTVKEENFSDADASDSQFDFVSRDLVNECNSDWSSEQDAYAQGSAMRTPGSTENESSNTGIKEDVPFPEYTIIPGGNMRGGAAMISSDGHRYGIKMIKPNVTYWRCVARNRFCNCRAVVIQRGNVFIRGTNAHCHPPNSTVDASSDWIS